MKHHVSALNNGIGADREQAQSAKQHAAQIARPSHHHAIAFILRLIGVCQIADCRNRMSKDRDCNDNDHRDAHTDTIWRWQGTKRLSSIENQHAVKRA